ncbi:MULTISPECIES: FAD/NAD(P)-binding protein [unclassified Marinobacter]|uniref:FAD/NAD(P)-binding protein n=1 Tax=unclassified Marinobacter TaxID=83889 RepID=UPI00200F6361|nr:MULTISPECIES: FAD/NAD(P)-binding protein [unclassified Marinobacter]UQG57368.1 FAD/NAD(P)-binding protein [Marinobacter sp. M4C]UQG66172.1 FAD/NAD(P)-binding protein [Marinobacter sp. M2C]UQG70452.1 FAD/NAD(P)-binding protein [Marinobacter sp. M1C]
MNASLEINFGIIGTGFSGTATLVHLVDNLIATRAELTGVIIFTVEPRSVNGPGLAYSMNETLDNHLCNNQACKMAVKDNDFVSWLASNRKRIVEKYGSLINVTHPHTDLSHWCPDPDAFYPRRLFGIYLNERFHDAVNLAEQHGIRVCSFNHSCAIDGYEQRNKFTIILKNLCTGELTKISNLDKVLLSTGHWTPSSPQESESQKEDTLSIPPYPASAINRRIEALTSVKRVINVYVKGMGPSAIDSILTAASQGYFTYSEEGHVVAYISKPSGPQVNITAVSRSGFFPAARGGVVAHDFQYLITESYEELMSNNPDNKNLASFLDQIDQEIRTASQGGASLRHVVDPPFQSAREKLNYDADLPILNDVIHSVILKARRLKFYRHLNSKDKRIYDQRFDSHFIRTAVPIPQLNAEKLLALFNAGVLKTSALGTHGSSNSDLSELGSPITTSGGGCSDSEYDLVINAFGQDFILSRHPSTFIKALLKRGEILPHLEVGYEPGGIALDGFDTYRALSCSQQNSGLSDTDGKYVSQHIYSLGVITRFWQNERNFADAIIEASSWISKEWAQYLSDRLQTSSPRLISAKTVRTASWK